MDLRRIAGRTSRLVITPRVTDFEAEPAGSMLVVSDPERDTVQEALANCRRSRRALSLPAVLGHLDPVEARHTVVLGGRTPPADAWRAALVEEIAR
jgi:hypothetical protein